MSTIDMESNPYGPPRQLKSKEPKEERWPNWLLSLFWFLFMVSIVATLMLPPPTYHPGPPTRLVIFKTWGFVTALGLVFAFLAIYGTVRNLRSR